MTSHQFAKQLLCEPDLPIVIEGDESGDLFDAVFSVINGENSFSGCPADVIVVSKPSSELYRSDNVFFG